MKYIAFLRAINVTRRYVKMDVLRQQFEALGFANIETYIQSGNVIFETDSQDIVRLETLIEEKLADGLGFEVPTMVRTGAEMRTIAHFHTIPPSPSTLYVSFLKSEPSAELRAKLIAKSTEVDLFQLEGKQLYWVWHRELGDSKFTNAKIERTLKTKATRRNISTVQKVVAKYF